MLQVPASEAVVEVANGHQVRSSLFLCLQCDLYRALCVCAVCICVNHLFVCTWQAGDCIRGLLVSYTTQQGKPAILLLTAQVVDNEVLQQAATSGSGEQLDQLLQIAYVTLQSQVNFYRK